MWGMTKRRIDPTSLTPVRARFPVTEQQFIENGPLQVTVMSTDKFARLTPEMRENLIAYLDGELNETEMAAIETTLSRNQVARHDLEQLSRAYELLEYLEKPQLSQEFTNQTMSLISLQAAQPWTQSAGWTTGLYRGVMLLVWGVAIVAAGAGGYTLASRMIPNDGDALLRDYPVIEKLDQYREVGDLEFLKQLEASHLFDTPRQSPPTPTVPRNPPATKESP